jgi:subtilisin family serine protease
MADEGGLLRPAERESLTESLKVGPTLVAALDHAKTAPVMIVFQVPGLTNAQKLGLQGGDMELAVEAVRAGADDLLLVLGDDFQLSHRLQTISAVAGEISTAGLLRILEQPAVVRADLDEGGRGGLVESRALTNVDLVISQGYSGSGVTVAILDSGIDTDHPDFTGAIADQRCFCQTGGGCCPNGNTTQSGAGSAEDDHGHGTLVAGVVTAKSSSASASSRRGAAPDASIVAIKVLDSNNSFSTLADVSAGLDWIITQKPDVDIVNMSLVTDALYSGNCDAANAPIMAIAQAVNTLRSREVPVFAAAGNEGSGTQMSAPACIANAISVGAVYDANVGSQNHVGSSTFANCTDSTTAPDKVTCFSNSNARTDLFAPGAPMTGPRLGGSGSLTSYGTSFSSPMAAACAADLLEAQPNLTANQIEAALESSTILVTDATNGRSFPRLECNQALASATAGNCVPSTTNLCLNNGRFRVSINWQTATSSGTAKVVNCSNPDSGMFWFFNANNWEMMVKVLNGCGVNNRYWVFAAGMTNQGWTLTVTDTANGQVKQYTNPLGQVSQTITDTAAFATCP